MVDKRIEPILGDFAKALENDPAIDPSMEGYDVQEITLEEADMSNFYIALDDGDVNELRVSPNAFVLQEK